MEKIIFDNVGVNFGKHVIFQNCSLELHAGRVIGIVGKNGSGKSTFLKLAGKILRPDEGVVNFFDGKILNPSECARKISAVTPEMKLYDELTVTENLKFFAKLRGKNLDAENIFRIVSKLGMDYRSLGNVRAGILSTGMRQRLKFAVLLSVDAEILLLDEPTSNLDNEGIKFFHAEIKNSAQLGKIVLLATNDKIDTEICDEVITLPIN